MRAYDEETPENTAFSEVSETDGEGFDGVSATACGSNNLPQSPDQGEAESEAVCPDSRLKEVVEAWPGLPEAIQAGIVAMIRASHMKS
jgi:hypothetical protein